MKAALAIVVVAIAFAVGALVYVLHEESAKNADPNRVVTSVDPPNPGRGD